MEIKTKTIAPFIAAAATAQGAYDEIAQECVADLAEELELKDLEKEVEAAFKKIEKLSDDDFDTYLEEAAKKEKEKAAKKSDKKTTASSGVKRKADGKVDLRTKEGKAIAERMEKARKAKEKNKKKGGVLSRLIKKLV